MSAAGSDRPISSTRILSELECRTLLVGQQFGRVAYISNGLPMIAPVNVMMFEDLVVFCSDPGDKVSNMPLRQVCFETEGEDDANARWSVIVHGLARDVTTALDPQYERMRQTGISPFAHLIEPHWMAIEIEHLTGRFLQLKPSRPSSR